MATGGTSPSLWDKQNQQQQKLIHGSHFDELLARNRVQLIKNLYLTGIWSYLRQYEVLTEEQEQTLKYNAPNHEVAGRLLDFIGKGPLWKFHGMLKACAETCQEHIISEILKLDLKDYSDEPAQQTNDSVELQKSMCEHAVSNQLNLMRRKVFDFQDDAAADIIDTTKCYIQIKAKCKGDQQLVFEIAEADILDSFHDGAAPRTIRLYGPGGAGKTTLLRHIAYVCSKKFLQHQKECQEKNHESCKWNTIVYIPARSIRGTMKEAIKDHLMCHRKDLMMTHVEGGEGVALCVDALDEVRDAKVLASIKAYIQERKLMGGPTILVSARTDLCPIDAECFHRFLLLEGFTVSQGMEYVRHYFSIGKSSSDKDHPVVAYTLRHSGKLEPVLQNPLWLHIFCGLTSKGILKLEENDDDFNMLKLFEPLEKYLIAREGSPVTEKQSQDFYRLCLYGMLTGMREFPESLLTEFNISPSYLVFLERCERRDANAVLVAYYSFGHEMVYEYFVSRFIGTVPDEEKKSLLLSICCESSLRNVQKIIFQMLYQQGNHEEMLQTMLQTILILNQDLDWTSIVHTKPEWKHFREWNKERIPTDELLLKDQDEEKKTNTSTMWAKIQKMFAEDADLMRSATWFTTLEKNGTLRHVQECLQICTPRDEQKFNRATIHSLLPCQYTDRFGEKFTHCTIDKTRWGVIRRDTSTVQLDVWCVDDAHNMLGHEPECTDPGVKRVGIYTDQYRDLWGQPPDATWSKEAWSRLLTLVTKLWPGRELYIWLPTLVSLTGLAQCLADPPVQLREGKRSLIYNGTLSFMDISMMREKCTDIPYKLTNARIMVPDCTDDSDLKTKRNELRDWRSLDGGVLHHPRWVKPTGEKHVWSDGYTWDLRFASVHRPSLAT